MSDLTAWQFALLQLIGVGYSVIGAFFVLVGVCIGGYLVYKTKREAHESLFRHQIPEQDTGPVFYGDDKDVFSPDEFSDDDEAHPAGYYDEGMQAVDDQVNAFIRQTAVKRGDDNE